MLLGRAFPIVNDVESTLSSHDTFDEVVAGENPGAAKRDAARDRGTEMLAADEFKEKYLDRIMDLEAA